MINCPDSVKVISFDIFDTLIIRPFVKPTDLFKLIEENADAEGFAQQRIDAEQKAKTGMDREITLDEIYFHVKNYQHLKDVEIDYEINLSMRNEPICRELELLSESHKILVTSDMYLPKNVIETILKKNNIPFDCLYLSSELGYTKYKGSMFKHILEKEHIGPNELLHIGDNRHSDVKIPMKMGIHTIHILSPIDQYFKINPIEKKFYKHHDNLTSSVLVTIDMLRKKQEDIWGEIGSKYGGPLVYGYTKFIKNSSCDKNVLLFTSRDGYSLIKSFKLIDPKIECHYVYLQRIINSVLYEEIDLDLLNDNLQGMNKEERNEIIKRVLDNLIFYKDELGIKTIPSNEKETIQVYIDNLMTIKKLKETRRDDYNRYLTEVCGEHDVCVIDSTSSKFSSQRLVQKVLDKEIYAMYLVTLKDEKALNYDSYWHWPYFRVEWTRVNLPEFLLCSPELPICGWKAGAPVFNSDVPKEEKERASKYESISNSEVEYTKMMIEIFGDYSPSFDYSTVNSWIMNSLKYSEQRNFLNKIKWASDANHLKWRSLISSDPRDILKRTIMTIIN